MKSERKTAVIVGVLFILATVFSLISTSLTSGVTGAPDYLAKIASNQNQVIIGTLFEFAAAISVFLIPAMMFPILRQFDESMALGYFGFRIMEAFTLVLDGFGFLLLVTLSREYLNAGSTASGFQTLGALLLGVHGWAFPLDPFFFGLGGFIFYYLLYKSKLIPRWLSIWGLIGDVMVFALSLLGLFGQFLVILAVPIAVQEMVLAVWLIAKGFDPSAIVSESAKIR